MNKRKFVLGWLLIGTIFLINYTLVRCHKSPKCWGRTITNEGIIAFDTVVCSNCTMTADENKQFVITNQHAYNSLIYYSYGNSGICALNPIDFSRYSLLGINTFITCNYTVVRDVTINDTDKKYIYSIAVNECGNCSEQSFIQHWVLIPKIKSGYAVDFVLTRY
jgi:hypothetical protein